MYYVKKRLMSCGKTAGFKCEYRKKGCKTKHVYLNKESINKLIDTGQIDIGINKRGYYFKDKSRNMSMLEVEDISRVSEYRNQPWDTKYSGCTSILNNNGIQKKISIKSVYTGQELADYISGLSYEKEVSKISKLKEYLEDRELYTGNCFIITGMKRTGKTVLVEQGIRYLLNKGVNSEDILLIQYRKIDETDYYGGYSGEIYRLMDYIKGVNCHYIFIDEITMLRELAANSKYIADDICKHNNRRVVLSGSDTLTFSFAETQGLAFRCFKISMTVLEYADWFRIRHYRDKLSVQGKSESIWGFISDCTLNKYSYYNTDEIMTEYLIDAIADNVINSIEKNISNRELRSGYGVLKGLSHEKVLFIFYIVCYDVIHSKKYATTLSSKGIRIGHKVNTLSAGNIMDSQVEQIKKMVIRGLGLADGTAGKIKVTDNEYSIMLDIMRRMDIVGVYRQFSTAEVNKKNDKINYVLKVPSIYNRFIINIISVCRIYYTKIDEGIKQKSINELYGLVFEAMIITQIEEYAKEYNQPILNSLGKLRISDEQEIDIIVQPGINCKGCLYDVKLSNRLKGRLFKTFRSGILKDYADIVKGGNIGIIYMGETTRTSDGLVAINAHDFLMDIGKYIN